MLTLPLAPTDDLAAPAFKDVASCSVWLAQFQLTNLQRAHSQLLTQLNELNRYPMQGWVRLNTLELLRETVGFVQEDMAKKLIATALPLSEHELKIFVAITQLWQSMVNGYQRCLQAYLAGDKKLSESGALLCDRCLQYTGLAIFEHLRTGYECNPKLWYQLHNLYAFAEEHKLEPHIVKDLSGHASTCRNRYIKVLLACHACPAELNRKQLKLLDRWLDTWSNDLRMESKCSRSKGDAPPLAVDLADKQGLQTLDAMQPGSSVRYLALVPLSKLLRVKLILLEQGTSLEQVGLGELPSAPIAIELLNFLHHCWCEESNLRLTTRSEESINTHLASNASEVVSLLGKSFGTTGEVWRIDNENLMGAHITRTTPGLTRLHRNQLIALKKTATAPVQMASVVWLQISILGQLQFGVHYLPGIPEALTLPALAVSTDKGKHIPIAFLLTALVTMRTPSSLILPRKIFKAGGVLAIVRANGVQETVKMGFSVSQGLDYERVSFMPH
jgi:cyclic-di-GMP-binding protein